MAYRTGITNVDGKIYPAGKQKQPIIYDDEENTLFNIYDNM